jgi:hypothetical protein
MRNYWATALQWSSPPSSSNIKGDKNRTSEIKIIEQIYRDLRY